MAKMNLLMLVFGNGSVEDYDYLGVGELGVLVECRRLEMSTNSGENQHIRLVT